jgi:adenylate cyclase
MERIILKCLEKEPGERFQSAKEIGVDLRRLTSGPTAAVSQRKRHLRLSVSKLGAVLLIVSAIGAGYFISRLFWPQSAAAQRIMLAVLPFDDLSGDSNQEYFSDGLTDEMISQLGRWQPRRLGVIARTSAIHYKGSKERIDQIGHELGVAYILEGSVRRDAGRVRITAELIHVADQTPLWAETYERDSADVFAVQSEVAGRITQSLALELLPAQHAPLLLSPTKDSAAHEAYLKGIYYLNSSSENYERAREYFEKAVQLDPKYAPAYASLAEYYWSTDKLPPQLAMPKAEQYALKSLELDGTLPEAHTALAGIRFFYNWDWPTAEKEFSRSLELNPSGAETHRLYALYLASLAGAEQAVREIRIAQQLDPFSLNINTTAGWVFNYTRQYDQAIEQCRKALEIDPDYVSAHDCLGDSYLAKGMFEEAAGEFRLAASGGEQLRAVGLARVYAVSGRRNEARSILDDLTKASKQSYFPPYLIGMIHVALGEKEQGLAWLEVAYTHRDPYLVHLKKDAAFDPLRSDPRFQDLLHRVGFSE